MSIFKKKGVDFGLNLGKSEICVLFSEQVTDDENLKETSESYERGKIYCKLHSDGWQISAKVEADYYTWISEFTATHADYGTIQGCLENEICAESEQSYNHFIQYHPIKIFDWGDI